MSWQVSDGPYYEGTAVEVDKHLKGVKMGSDFSFRLASLVL